MKHKNLEEWLFWAKNLHVKDIDLSLERVKAVADRMGLIQCPCPLVIVGGTNGKGSTVAGLEAIYSAAGYKVAAFTSPYLFKFNEQIRIQGTPVADAMLCEAFQAIASDGSRLTLFELTTLAALWIFKKADVDVCLLEVGLGGRYDAVNVMEADVAIVTSIGIDHVEWLGATRDAIAFEKAGIFRPGKAAICGDFDPPQSLLNYATAIKTNLYCQTKAFGFEEQEGSWTWWSNQQRFEGLPLPTLALQNLSSVLMAVELLQCRLPVLRAIVDRTLPSVALTGRLEAVPGNVPHIFDVSHNPAAVSLLADYLEKKPCAGKTIAVFSMLADKDIETTILTVQQRIDTWHIAPLQHERGAGRAQLMACFLKTKTTEVNEHDSIALAYEAALKTTGPLDRIVVFGSFHTVAGVRPLVSASGSGRLRV